MIHFLQFVIHFNQLNSHVKYPSRSPGFIIVFAPCTRRLPLMPHHRNGRTGRDGVIRAEPGASASAWLVRRQANHGRRWGALLTWERGAVASMITATVEACRCTCSCIYSFSLLVWNCPCSDCPAFQTWSFYLGLEVEALRHLVPRSTLAARQRGKNKEETKVRTAILISICSFLRDSQDCNKVGKGLTDNRTPPRYPHERGDVAFPMLFLAFGAARFFAVIKEINPFCP